MSEKLGIKPSTISGIWRRNGFNGKDKRIYYLLNENYFEKINNSNKAYFLGFIASDGCIYKSKKTNKQGVLRISIHKKDSYILDKFKEELNTNKEILNNKEYVCLEISSEKIFKDIELLDLKERKTYSNTIPNLKDIYMPDFIRGYVDGDGCVSIDKNGNVNVSIAGYMKNMIKIQDFLKKFFIYSNFHIDKRKKYKNDFFGNLSLDNKTSKYCFLKMIYRKKGDMYLYRKYDNAKKFIESVDNSTKNRDLQIVNYYKYIVEPILLEMENKEMKIKRLTETAKIPTRGSEYAAGYDLYADVKEEIIIQPHETVKIGTGVAIQPPHGYFGAIVARSGLATKKGLAPGNKIGIADEDYVGEYIVALHNHSNVCQSISPQERIAQVVFIPYFAEEFEEVDELDSTERGDGGFGSTGKN